jgi:hypothetical protein
LATTAWDAVMPAEVNRNKANAWYQGVNYMEAFGNGLPDNATSKEKFRYIQNVKVAANNVTAAQAIIGLFGSPAYRRFKR